MQSPCIREASTACFRGCCTASLPGLPEFNISGSPSSKEGDFIAATVSSLPPNTQFTNHESLPSLPQSFSKFTKSYPQFLLTNQADQIRAQHYSHLSASNHVCLDYTGQGLFSSSQQHQENCKNFLFFDVRHKSITLNSQIQHSGGQESEFESRIQKRIMSFMNISTDDYFMVFTANKSSAFKLLADSYPFSSYTNLVTVYDHESEAVEGMIQIATRKGAKARSAAFTWPNLRVHFKKLKKILMSKRKKKGLFAIPLQSGITGARCSYLWMSMAQENGWHVLLDASSLGAKDMDTLGLSLFKPDFLICSFYKIFGDNPSGFGCLFIKKSAASLFSNSDTAIGIVSLIPAPNVPDQMGFRDKEDTDIAGPSSLFDHRNSERSEIVEVDKPGQPNQPRVSGNKEFEFHGLDNADELGLVLISTRTRCLVNWLVNALMKLIHPNSENGLKLVRIYGPKIRIDRGPAVAFNVFDWKGEKIDPILVQKLADRNNISLGCGFLHHIWFPNKYELEKERFLELRKDGIKLEDGFHPKVHVLTVSVGFLTNFEDLYRLWAFVSRFLDADFVEKERWRYMALNQTTIEI